MEGRSVAGRVVLVLAVVAVTVNLTLVALAIASAVAGSSHWTAERILVIAAMFPGIAILTPVFAVHLWRAVRCGDRAVALELGYLAVMVQSLLVVWVMTLL